MFKNVASQKIVVYAWDSGNSVPKTGDAANITAYISKDGGAAAQSNDVNPTELDATNMKGFYVFDLTQAETNCDQFIISPVSATASIEIEPQMVYTNPAYFTTMSIESDGDLTKVNTCATNTDMRGTDNALLAANVPTNFSSLGIESDGDITKVNELDGQTVQTGDSYAVVSDVTSGNAALKTLIDALNDIAASDILSTSLTESYAADGAERTLTQILYELKAFLTQFGIVGTAYTTKKLDGITTAKVYTTDDATDPTAITETT